LLILGLFLAVIVVSGAAIGPEPSHPAVEGVRYVENPAAPLRPPVTIALEELWRIGGNSEKEGEFFGVIADVAVDDAGEVYVLDGQLSEVRVFSPDGHYLRTIGHEGEGPGEFRRPTDLLFLPDGRLAVVQPQPPRLVLLQKHGASGGFLAPVGEKEGYRLLQEGAYRGGSLVLMSNGFHFSKGSVERRRRLYRIDLQGERIALYDEASYRHLRGRPTVREREGVTVPWALGPDGVVYASLDFDYSVRSWRADGSLARIITREYRPHIRSAKERDAERERLASGVRITGPGGRRIQPEVQVSDRDRSIRWLAVDESGHLWVLPGRSVRESTPGTIGPFDVFDPQGRYLQAVTLRGRGDLDEDRTVLAGDRLFVLTQYASAYRGFLGSPIEEEKEGEKEGRAEPMSVICYGLKWTPPAHVDDPGAPP
jgi:hypothetical protein